jgi:cellobiose phosphorylase
VAADFDAGRIEKAFDTWMRFLPHESRSEPFAQVNGYVGPSAWRMKRHVSDDPWRSGTVGWNWINCVDRFLGFRRELGGFRLSPRMPAKWKQLSYVRPFRGTDFQIEVKRGPAPGVTVDGNPVDGDFIAVPKGGLGKKKVKIVCTVA